MQLRFENAAADSAAEAQNGTTPAGLEATQTLFRRRLFVLTVNVAIWGALMASAASILAAGGWTWLDRLMIVCFAFATPWTALGVTNAAIGFTILRLVARGRVPALPFANNLQSKGPLTAKTAILMTIRNEDPHRALLRLKTVKRSLDATGEGAHFTYFVLSDTSRLEFAAKEEDAVARWREGDLNGERIIYRRRTDNAGFKAGNIRDFCETFGGGYDFMVTLDADSLMTGPAIIQLVKIMETYPRLGILQSLVVGTPARSPFTRLFQFGMRLGMRAYTAGQAWWVGDCGPYWGHNAIVRIAPFAKFCALPVLPGKPPLGGQILSHDQIEAVLMRRAGYEVRVLPVESGSFEDNPPDALQFIERDVRWCQGNMQYLKLLTMPGIKPVSRFQLIWAVLMFAGIPAWTVMIAALPFAAAEAPADFPSGSAKLLYVTFLLMFLAPKIAGFADALLTPGEAQRFGGPVRYALSAALEVVFAFLQGAISSIRTSIFMAGLILGKSVLWRAQQRDPTGLSWQQAISALWPQTAFGLVVCSALAFLTPTVLVWSLPLTAGFVLAIPFSVITASPRLGRFFEVTGLGGIPEDFVPVPEITAIEAAQS